jgi:DNA-binding transcriptional LysR family regulator
LHVESTAIAKQVVKGGDSIALLPRLLVAAELSQGSLAALDWQPAWLHTQYGFAYPRERTLSAGVRAFMAEVRAIEAELFNGSAPSAPRGRKRARSR